MLVHCRHVPKHAGPHLEFLTCTPQEDPGPPAGTTGWEALLSRKEEPDPTKAHLPARGSQHITTNHPLSSTYYVLGTVPMLTCHTPFDCHTNPTGLDDTPPFNQWEAKAERCSPTHVQPLTWGAALRDVKLGLSKVKACLRPLVLYGVTHLPRSQFLPDRHTTPAIIYLIFFFKLMS